jgi:hypothetical protein
MNRSTLRLLGMMAFLALASGCGGPAPQAAQSGGAASAAGVEITGHLADPGTRGSILVFAYTDLGPGEDVAAHEPASVSTLAADGTFDLEVPPCSSLTLVFLADGSSDGVVDEGDPVAVLTGPELADLHGGDHVHVADARIDFLAHRITATIEVARAGEPEHTPTPVPAV